MLGFIYSIIMHLFVVLVVISNSLNQVLFMNYIMHTSSAEEGVSVSVNTNIVLKEEKTANSDIVIKIKNNKASKEKVKHKSSASNKGVSAKKGSNKKESAKTNFSGSKHDKAKKAAKELEKVASEIQTKVMENWFPPEKYAARDVNIKVLLLLNSKGYIVSYKLINAENTAVYKAVAESVMRTLNNPHIMPFELGKTNLKRLILSFSPRDLME